MAIKNVHLNGDVGEATKWIPWAEDQATLLSLVTNSITRKLYPTDGIEVLIQIANWGQRIIIDAGDGPSGLPRLFDIGSTSAHMVGAVFGGGSNVFVSRIALSNEEGDGNIPNVALPRLAKNCEVSVSRTVRPEMSTWKMRGRIAVAAFKKKQSQWFVGAAIATVANGKIKRQFPLASGYDFLRNGVPSKSSVSGTSGNEYSFKVFQVGIQDAYDARDPVTVEGNWEGKPYIYATPIGQFRIDVPIIPANKTSETFSSPNISQDFSSGELDVRGATFHYVATVHKTKLVITPYFKDAENGVYIQSQIVSDWSEREIVGMGAVYYPFSPTNYTNYAIQSWLSEGGFPEYVGDIPSSGGSSTQSYTVGDAGPYIGFVVNSVYSSIDQTRDPTACYRPGSEPRCGFDVNVGVLSNQMIVSSGYIKFDSQGSPYFEGQPVDYIGSDSWSYRHTSSGNNPFRNGTSFGITLPFYRFCYDELVELGTFSGIVPGYFIANPNSNPEPIVWTHLSRSGFQPIDGTLTLNKGISKDSLIHKSTGIAFTPNELTNKYEISLHGSPIHPPNSAAPSSVPMQARSGVYVTSGFSENFRWDGGYSAIYGTASFGSKRFAEVTLGSANSSTSIPLGVGFLYSPGLQGINIEDSSILYWPKVPGGGEGICVIRRYKMFTAAQNIFRAEIDKASLSGVWKAGSQNHKELVKIINDKNSARGSDGFAIIELAEFSASRVFSEYASMTAQEIGKHLAAIRSAIDWAINYGYVILLNNFASRELIKYSRDGRTLVVFEEY